MDPIIDLYLQPYEFIDPTFYFLLSLWPLVQRIDKKQ